MCWCLNFGFSGNKKAKGLPSEEKKRRGAPADDVLHGRGKTVVAEVSEKHRSKETHRKRSSGETVAPRSPRRAREERRSRSQYQDREQYRPNLNVRPPERWDRSVEPGNSDLSEELLLNPRPHRSQHNRQRHPKHTSQSTLRGRGAKRDPPRHSKSKKNLKPEPSGWSFFAPSPPKNPSRRNYQALDSSPRSHRSLRQHHSTRSQESPESSRSQNRSHRSRQHERQAPSSRSTRSRTPNTTARRVPDRRFAVLAATNQALENVRREAFAQPSPPPPRQVRVRQYEGVTLPTSQIPFNWDCVSSSQTSSGHSDGTARPRRSRR